MTNFEKMTSKKLTALLATVNEEDKATIQEILAKRAQVAEQVEEETELTPEEEAAIAQAEANGGLNPLHNSSKSSQEKKAKMTDEQLHMLAEECKANVGHKCEAVPFNTVDWVKGYIAGVIEEKRARKVLYAIKLEDGRRVVKVYDSNLLKISEETVDLEKVTRSSRAPKTEWTDEMCEEIINANIVHVGKKVEVVTEELTTEEGNTEKLMVSGRIIALVPDRRAQKVFNKIALDAPTEDNPEATKITYKVVGSDKVVIAEEFDEEGLAFNEKYVARRENRANNGTVSAVDRIKKAEALLQKAEERLQKAQSEVEARKAALEKLLAETQQEASTEENSDEEPLD